MRHILSILMENKSGAMSRVVGLFSARDYNIDSLSVAPTEDPTLSRMTIVTRGDSSVIEQITKQLNKLIEVVKVVDLNESRYVERELMLVKVRAVGKDRDEILRLCDIYRGQVIDVSDKSYTISNWHQRKNWTAFGKHQQQPDFGNRAHGCGWHWSRRTHFAYLNSGLWFSGCLNENGIQAA